MGLFRPSRERYGPDPYYHLKAIVFTVGSGIGLFGMISQRDWLVLAAIPVLLVGVALRWLRRRQQGAQDEAQEPEQPAERDDPEVRNRGDAASP